VNRRNAMYQKINFYIDSQYQWGHGFPDSVSESSFHQEARQFFQAAGWKVSSGRLSGESDTATKGKQSLYLHPMEFSGVILTEEVPELKHILSSAKTFRLRSVGQFEIYQDMSDQDYAEYLESCRTEIIEDILANYRTKRKNQFIVNCNMAEKIGQEYRILRVNSPDHIGDKAYMYVGKLIEELIADGRLRTGATKKGLGIRTAVPSDFKNTPELFRKGSEATT